MYYDIKSVCAYLTKQLALDSSSTSTKSATGIFQFMFQHYFQIVQLIFKFLLLGVEDRWIFLVGTLWQLLYGETLSSMKLPNSEALRDPLAH